MPRATMTTLFAHARAAAACAALALASAPPAFALGGDDVNTGTKVNAATQVCQATIAKGGTTYAQKVALAMNGCLDALVKCDEQATADKALTCRRALLVPITGKCSVGKVDEGASLLSTGAAAHAASLPLSKAALIREMNKYTKAIQKKCFDVAGVDLGSALQGLGFSPTPADNLAVADATNQDPGGVQCLANGLVLQTHPLADDMTDLLETLHETCVVADVPGDLGIACSVNADCGPTKGRCGQLARVFREGSVKPCAGAFPATGQTTCWDSGGSVISCAGTGQDGELLAGAALAYVDNGDGTISDLRTGLMWEKFSDDGSIHDKDNIYTWADAFAVKVATLNSGGGFVGYTDWRVPNIRELESIVNRGTHTPSISGPFHTSCSASCTVTTCSCTQSDLHFSSSSGVGGPTSAWGVNFGSGSVLAEPKANTNRVRAVRGGW